VHTRVPAASALEQKRQIMVPSRGARARMLNTFNEGTARHQNGQHAIIVPDHINQRSDR
jgi:hypothetical protein